MPITPTEKDWLKPKEVAAMLETDTRTLRRWSKNGRFVKPVKNGSRWVRFRRTEVEAWLAEHRA